MNNNTTRFKIFVWDNNSDYVYHSTANDLKSFDKVMEALRQENKEGFIIRRTSLVESEIIYFDWSK